jgi:hypothetical protein
VSGDEFESPSLISRLLRDPVKLRRNARILSILVALVAAIAGSGWLTSSVLASTLTALAWLFVPVMAAGIGTGDAFFLRHGVGERRVALTALLGVVFAIFACALLAVIGTADESTPLLAGALHFVLVIAVIGVLASILAVAIGRGGGYLSRRIQDVDDAGW